MTWWSAQYNQRSSDQEGIKNRNLFKSWSFGADTSTSKQQVLCCQHSEHNMQYFLGDCHIWECNKVQLAKGKLKAETGAEGRGRRSEAQTKKRNKANMDKIQKRQGSVLNFSDFPRSPPIHKGGGKKNRSFSLAFLSVRILLNFDLLPAYYLQFFFFFK